MNGNIKGVIGFILGVVAGGVAAYIYQDRRLSKKFEEELKVYQEKDKKSNEENTDDTNNTISEEMNSNNAENDTEIKGDADVKNKNLPQDAIDAAKKMQEGVKKAREDRENKGARERSKTNYAKLTRNYSGNSDEEETKKGGNDMTLSEKLIKNKPYYISREEFYEMDGKDGYRAIDLFYNADDDTICNDDGEILEDDWLFVGRDIQQDLYDGKTDDEVYVRNDEFKEVYCISKNFML